MDPEVKEKSTPEVVQIDTELRKCRESLLKKGVIREAIGPNEDPQGW